MKTEQEIREELERIRIEMAQEENTDWENLLDGRYWGLKWVLGEEYK